MVHAAGSGTEASTGTPGQEDQGASIVQLGLGAMFILVQVRTILF